MPQPKKHQNHAEGQAAYRRRQEQTREVERTARGLPHLPAIPTLPGWPRWSVTFTLAHALIEGALREMQEYFDDRSDTWQEGERGLAHQEKITSAEAVLEALGELLP